MKTALQIAACILACAAIAGAAEMENIKISAGSSLSLKTGTKTAVPAVDEANLRVPTNPGQVSPQTQIFSYASPSSYTFENEAKKALNACISNFQAAGLNVISGRVFPKGNDYSFGIEYADGGNITAQLPAFSIVRYETPASYWVGNEAKKALQQSTAWFRNAGLNVIGGEIFERDTQNIGFSVDYVMAGVTFNYAPQYAQPRTADYISSKVFSFENQARSAAASAASVFASAGIRVLDSYAVATPDNDYRFAITYLTRAGQTGPQAMAFKSYQSSEEFSFENEARKAMLSQAALFNNAGLRVVDAYAVPLGNQSNYFGYILRYMVRNMPGYDGQVYEEANIQLYRENQTYPFENEAKGAMKERQQALSKAGFAILGGKVIPAGNDYTFTVEYVVKAQPPQPQYPQYPGQHPQYPQQPQYQPQPQYPGQYVPPQGGAQPYHPQHPQQGGTGHHQPGHTTIEVTED